MKNLKTFDEFVNESKLNKSKESLNEGKQVNNKKWVADPTIVPYIINATDAKKFIENEEELDNYLNQEDWGDHDLAGYYEDSTDDANWPWLDDNATKLDTKWMKAKRTEIKSEIKKLRTIRTKMFKQFVSKFPHMTASQKVLYDQNLDFDWGNVYINKIGPNKNSVILQSWYGHAKLTAKEIEGYGITMPQFLASILSFRNVAYPISY
jgi:hypothetical protein